MVNSRTNSVNSQYAKKVVGSEWISMSSLLFCVLTINPLLIRWILYRTRAILSSLLILLQSATTWSPHLVCQSCRTSDQVLLDDIWFIRLTLLMTPQHKCDCLRFFWCFQGSAYANDYLRPKNWYENNRKNMENLLEHKLEKCWFSTEKLSKSPVSCGQNWKLLH